MIDIWVLNALQGKELKIFGNENKTLDFTYIDDFIEGILLVMNQKNEVYDLSSGKATKLTGVADYIISLAGGGSKCFELPEMAQPQEVELDISKIKAQGYSPRVDIFEGVRKTFDWYKRNFEEIMRDRD